MAILGLGWLSREVLWAWRHAPYDWGAGWIALAWIGWVLWQGWRSGAEPKASLLGAGIVFGLLSWIGELNAAAHAGMVLAVASWLPTTRLQLAGVIMGAAWLPAFGWAASSVASPLMVFGLRVVLIGGVAAVFRKQAVREEAG